MSLREYKRKRNFGVTSEPGPKASKKASGRSFVIQKHDASRLHYDFRLEMGGALASWAVPKGFPVEHGVRHLAVHVEDHPLDYADFEGIIPKGQYGGGTVMVWDTGTYELLGGEPLQAVKEGKLHFLLHGAKLEGEWTLVQSHREGDEKNWFLIKTGESVRPISKKQEEHSILSGRTLRQIAEEKSAVWDPNHGLAADERAKAKRPPTASAKAKNAAQPGAAKARAAVKWIEPMKAKLAGSPPEGKGWIYELKWDGFRAIAVKNGDDIQLVSRNKKSLTAEFLEIRKALATLGAETAVLDGEICALDPQGRPRFQLLQSRSLGQARPPIRFYVFDLLSADGRDWIGEPLSKRKEALAKMLEGSPDELRLSSALDGNVGDLLAKVGELEMEGLIAKRLDSFYQPGKRSGDWLKLKVASEQEFVIGGFTPPEGSRKHFGALVIGYYAGGKLRFAGKVGTGFNQASLTAIHKQLQKIRVEKCPFIDLPRKSSGRWAQGLSPAEARRCTWVEPELVCQVRFAEWTDDGNLRQPVFLGLREDKEAKEVVREQAS